MNEGIHILTSEEWEELNGLYREHGLYGTYDMLRARAPMSDVDRRMAHVVKELLDG